jgi:hypothetical protein
VERDRLLLALLAYDVDVDRRLIRIRKAKGDSASYRSTTPRAAALEPLP